jgi:FKBP-type peptidyl-prolyl cis-trans isomerase 2
MSITTISRLCLGAAVLMLSLPVFSQEADQVAPGKTVELEITMSLEDGTVVQSNRGEAPVQYVHGEGQLFPRLEDELDGMHVDDEKSVTLEAEEAFGPADAEAIREVPRDSVPEEAHKVGAQLQVDGIDWPVVVSSVTPESLVVDFNHPLAGETLRVDVRVLSIS